MDTAGVVADILAHHGVKGQKWGVRKAFKEARNKSTQTASFKTADGKTVTLTESRISPIEAGVAAVNPRFRKTLAESRAFKMSVDGKQIGRTTLRKKSADEVNFQWIGVNRSQRGKGYASTVFDAGVDYARSQGFKKITLEVPGNAPDARHIYEKRGFTPTGVTFGNSKDIWGGLTEMSYTIPPKKAPTVKHAAQDDELEKAFIETFTAMGLPDGDLPDSVTHGEQVAADILVHHGIKGQRWGIRKGRGTATAVAVKATPGKRIKVSGGENQPAHDDAVRARSAGQKAKKSSTDSLSNKELQDLVTRMNLEQQLSRLTPASKTKAGAKFAADILGNVAKQQVTKIASDQISKQLNTALNKK